MLHDNACYLVTNVINFSSEIIDDLPKAYLVDINDVRSMSVEVDMIILIEPDLDWLEMHKELINAKEALTLILIRADKPYTASNFTATIDSIITVDRRSYQIFINDIIESVTQDHMIGVDFADFRTVMRKGDNTANLHSGGYTQLEHFYNAYFNYYFPDGIDFYNAKALFVIISFSMDYISGIDDFETVGDFFKSFMSPDATIVVTAHFNSDAEGARVSAIFAY